MTRAEKIAQAFGRGLAEGLVGTKGNGNGPDEPPETAPLPPVIPMDSIKEAVRQVLEPLIAEDEAKAPAPSQQELDLYTHGIEDLPADENAERIRQRVEEARLRREAEAGLNRVREGEYDPNAPNLSGWTSPQRHE